MLLLFVQMKSMKLRQIQGLIMALMSCVASGFISPVISRGRSLSSPPSLIIHPSTTTTQHGRIPTLRAQLNIWDRLQIEEDEEPMWYLLNCIAGFELNLLNQCRMLCSDKEGVVKFVVPMERSTRSHGPNRIVTENKVKYQGYVFANLKLSKKTYEAIQSLNLCRSWMGTVNLKGHKKLPPVPVALNEIEIENFGLENLEEGMELLEGEAQQDGEIDDGVILDTPEEEARQEEKKTKIDKEQLAVYMGLRPEDMIKVTGENKFKGEDGIVKRLKGEKIKVRFFTYGSTYEEWLDPNEVRKMTQDEVLRGLTGPSEPITQNQMDGGDDDPTRDRRSNLRRPGGLRDGLMSNVSGFRGPRNRRFDREQRGEHGRRGFQDQVKGLQQEEKNWQWYQEQQRKNNGPRDDQFEMGIGSQRAKKDWSSDDDAQWGRQNSQRQQRRERRDNRRAGAPVADEEDWNSFVSKADDSEKSSSVDDDAFFDSLMSELEDEEETPAKNNVASKSKSKDEDDFFTSLMNELNDDEPARQPRRGEEQNRRMTKKDKAPAGPNKDEEDFFAALEAELSGTTTDSNAAQSEDGDDFFAKLESELEMELGGDDLQKEDSFDSLFGEESNTMSIERGEQSLENEMSEAFDELFSSSNNDDDNGDPLEYKSEQRRAPVKAPSRAEEDMVSTGIAVATQPSSPAVATAGSTDGGSLQKKKVPELKEMLREKGLKVSGKKSELIERLLQG